MDEASTPRLCPVDVERGPAEEADLLVLVDHPDRPAVRRRETSARLNEPMIAPSGRA